MVTKLLGGGGSLLVVSAYIQVSVFLNACQRASTEKERIALAPKDKGDIRPERLC